MPLQISPAPASVHLDPMWGSVQSSQNTGLFRQFFGGSERVAKGRKMGKVGKLPVYPLGWTCCCCPALAKLCCLSPAPSGATFPAFLPLSQCPGNRKQTWGAEGRLVRTGLVGKALKKTNTPSLALLPASSHTPSLATVRKPRQAWGCPWGYGGPQFPSLDMCWGNPGGRIKGKFYFYKFKGQSPSGHMD